MSSANGYERSDRQSFDPSVLSITGSANSALFSFSFGVPSLSTPGRAGASARRWRSSACREVAHRLGIERRLRLELEAGEVSSTLGSAQRQVDAPVILPRDVALAQ